MTCFKYEVSMVDDALVSRWGLTLQGLGFQYQHLS
jgi:hypothetical protein